MKTKLSIVLIFYSTLVVFGQTPTNIILTGASDLVLKTSTVGTKCGFNNGSITAEVFSKGGDVTGEFEFSIHSQGPWTSSNTFDDLSAGYHTIWARLYYNNSFVISGDFLIEDSSTPFIQNVFVTDAQECAGSNEGGVIDIDWDMVFYDSDIQFSINGGRTWSSRERFTNLPPGTYEIAVGISGYPECTSHWPTPVVLECPAEVHCTDGIQNEGETGVDCGGEDCPPCETLPCENGTLNENDFEAGWGIWQGGDFARRVSQSTYAFSDPYSIQLRYRTPGSAMTSTPLDLSSYEEVTLEFVYYTVGFRSDFDHFLLQYSPDGNIFANLQEWRTPTHFLNNQHYNESVTIGGPLSSTSQFRIKCVSRFTSRAVYIDDVKITGCTEPVATCFDGIQNGDETGVDCGGSCPFCPPDITDPTCPELENAGPNACPPVGDPYIEEGCIAGLERYLGRSVDMKSLGNMITPNGKTTCCDTTPGACTHIYCPDFYCGAAQMLVEMEAGFVTRAAGRFGDYKGLTPGDVTGFWQALHQIPRDINKAYDCAGLRRPILQAGIFEWIDDSVDGIQIPQYVLNAFMDDPGFDPSMTHFDFSEINFQVGDRLFDGDYNIPDITRIQAKMWFYYQATIYINAGYQSLHMGQIRRWGRLDEACVWNTGAPTTINRFCGCCRGNKWTHTHSLIQKIRQFAKDQDSFVLLTSENSHLHTVCVPNPDITEHGTEMMFDFNTASMRPREVLASATDRAGQMDQEYYQDCDGHEYEPEDVLPSECWTNEQFNAFIDRCHSTYKHSGINNPDLPPVTSPQGCEYEIPPVYIYWDFGDPGRNAPQLCDYNPSIDHVWGWDDNGWWMQLGIECQQAWLEMYAKKVREWFPGAPVFLQMPGHMRNLRAKVGENQCNPGAADGPDVLWRLWDQENDPVQQVAERVLGPNPISIELVGEECTFPFIPNSDCVVNGFPAPGLTKRYYFETPNCDAGSTYSWHVRRISDNVELPMTYGSKKTLSVDQSGVYEITLRQDNMGLPSPHFRTVSITINLDAFCCNGFQLNTQNLNDGVEDMVLFPNPAQDKAFIQFNLNRTERQLLNESIEIKVSTIQGQVIQKIQTDRVQVEVDLSQFDNGVYYFHTILGGRSVYKTLVINK